MTQSDKLRMVQWLVVSATCYAVALSFPMGNPLSSLFWKLGHVTIAAHAGYWIARQSLGRINDGSAPNDKLARAIVISGAMLAVAMGM